MRFLRRVLNMLVVLLFVSLLMFVLVRVLPGDPVGAALGDGATKERPRVHAVTSGDRIEAIGFQVWERRVVVTKWDAGMLLLKCLARAMVRPFSGPRDEQPFSPKPPCLPPYSPPRKVVE